MLFFHKVQFKCSGTFYVCVSTGNPRDLPNYRVCSLLTVIVKRLSKINILLIFIYLIVLFYKSVTWTLNWIKREVASWSEFVPVTKSEKEDQFEVHPIRERLIQKLFTNYYFRTTGSGLLKAISRFNYGHNFFVWAIFYFKNCNWIWDIKIWVPFPGNLTLIFFERCIKLWIRWCDGEWSFCELHETWPLKMRIFLMKMSGNEHFQPFL